MSGVRRLRETGVLRDRCQHATQQENGANTLLTVVCLALQINEKE